MITKLSQKQIQKTILSPSMQQSIEILLLPIHELDIAIEKELEDNPLLEMDEKTSLSSSEHLDNLIDESIYHIKNSQQTPSFSYNSGNENNEDSSKSSPSVTPNESLEDYLLNQLKLETSDEEIIMIGEKIISELDEHGYLHITCADIAQSLNISDIQKIENVLKMIQNLEPIGIASKSLRECLILQAQYKFNGKSERMKEVLVNHLEALGKKQFDAIAKKLKIPLEDVKEIAKNISKLNPRPAAKYRDNQINIYIKPDIIVNKEPTENDEEIKFTAQINSESIPTLKVSAFYKKLLRQENLSEEENNFIREKIKNALLFIKSIEQRNHTILNIAQYIVNLQKDFFLYGSEHIKPLTLKDIARHIDRNESTISRAIKNKYILTPQGLIPLKYFFSQALCQNNDKQTMTSSRSVKEEIKFIIEDENKNNPLSDQSIQNIFVKRNIPIARRTISKYRKALHILPSHLRKS